MTSRLGVCSWSLLPHSPADLVRKVTEVGVSAVQLALDPLRTGDWPLDQTVDTLVEAGIEIRSGMMVMRGEDYSTLDTIKLTGGVRLRRHWDANLAAADGNAAIAARLGLKLVTFHAGFLPHDRTDPLFGVMIERLRAVVDRFAARGVRVAFETGQEKAETLNNALEQLDRAEVGVNFDPANMILYGMGDPVAALRRLAPRVLQIHVKDALPAATVGTWGQEVVVGAGVVDWPALLHELARGGRCGGAHPTDLGFRSSQEHGRASVPARRDATPCLAVDGARSTDLMIEREAVETRIADIRQARELVVAWLAGEGMES